MKLDFLTPFGFIPVDSGDGNPTAIAINSISKITAFPDGSARVVTVTGDSYMLSVTEFTGLQTFCSKALQQMQGGRIVRPC